MAKGSNGAVIIHTKLETEEFNHKAAKAAFFYSDEIKYCFIYNVNKES